MIAIFVIAIVLCALTADYAVERLTLGPSLAKTGYADDGHLMVLPESSGLVTIAMDEVAACLLGRPERVEWLRSGAVVAGTPLAILHDRGRSLVLRAPLDGEIVEENRSLVQPSTQAKPETDSNGWLLRMRPARPDVQLARMHTGDRMREWMRNEMDRLRAALVARLPQSAVVGAAAFDGGPPSPALAAELDDATYYDVVRAMLGEGAVADRTTGAGKESEP